MDALKPGWAGAVRVYEGNAKVQLMRREMLNIVQALTVLTEYMEMMTPMFVYGGLEIVLYFLVWESASSCYPPVVCHAARLCIPRLRSVADVCRVSSLR